MRMAYRIGFLLMFKIAKRFCVSSIMKLSAGFSRKGFDNTVVMSKDRSSMEVGKRECGGKLVLLTCVSDSMVWPFFAGFDMDVVAYLIGLRNRCRTTSPLLTKMLRAGLKQCEIVSPHVDRGSRCGADISQVSSDCSKAQSIKKHPAIRGDFVFGLGRESVSAYVRVLCGVEIDKPQTFLSGRRYGIFFC